MSKKKNKKNINPNVMNNIAKIKDAKKVFFFTMIAFVLLLVFGLFGSAYYMDAEFRKLNSPDVANASGVPYSVVVLKEHIRYGNFILGVPSEKMEFNYFQPLLLIIFIVQLITLGLFLIPLKGRIKKANKYKNIAVGVILIISAIFHAIIIFQMQGVLESALYDIISIMEYLASSPYTVTAGGIISITVACISFGGVISIVDGLMDFYLEKHNA